MNTVLLLTGTINVQNISFMKRNDYETRKNDYERSLNKWLKIKDLKIVFVENSNFKLDEFNLKVLNNANFEYLTFNGQNFPRHKGKGYGEIRAMEYAIKNSKLINNSSHIVKCNGRYFFKGIKKLVNLDYDLVCNFKKDLKYADSRVFYFNKIFFEKYFIKYKDLMDDSKLLLFETNLAKAAHLLLSDDGKWKYIPFPLIIEGFSGTDNVKVNSSRNVILSYIKFIRNLLG